MYRQESNSLRRRNLEDKPFLNLIDEPSNVMEDWTPFHWATHTGRLDKMKTLLSNLANPFLPTRMKRNALHQAAEAKSLEVMNYVLQIPEHPLQGWFDIDLQDEWGETALHVAVYGKSADSVRCVEMLLAKGARRDLPRKGDLAVPLHLASWAKEDVKSAIVDLLSSDKGSHINSRDRRERTPIFSLLGNPECVELLLSRGADMFICDEDAMSILHVACIEDRVDALKLFLPRAGHGLDTSIDKDGHTPLRKAIECKSIACAKVLLEAGAIGDLNSKDGLTLVHRAIEMGDSDFLKDCFEHSTFKKGSLTLDGRSVMEFASRKGKFKGRIEELIKEYESFAPRHLAKSRPVTQYTTELERAQATAEYFVLR